MPDSIPQQSDALRADHYRLSYEMSGIGIFRSTPDGRYVMANPAGVRMHGYDSEADLLRAVNNIPEEVYVDPNDRDTMRRLLETQGKIEGFECEIYRHKTRERFWVRQNLHRVTDDEGRLLYLEGYVEDITDRKCVEEELRQAREDLEVRVAERTAQLQAANRALEEEIAERQRAEDVVRTRDAWLRAILENAPIEVVLKDTSGRIMAISRNVADDQNVPVEAIVGTTTANYLPAEIAEVYMAADRQVVETGAALQSEVREEADGKVRYSLNQKFPMRDEQGAIRGICSLTTDITEMKEAEARLAQAMKMEAVGQLTGGVAHDFNNLLAVIRGNAEMLAMGKVEKLQKQTEAILHATQRGAELTLRLLAFSRRQPLRPRTIDLAALTRGMIGMIERTLGETIAVETAAAPDLWLALADPGQVENVLLNLAINARDAMPDGGRLTIECRNLTLDAAGIAHIPEAVAGDFVILTVSDTGAGMSPEVRDHAFEPFFTTKEVGQGSGLGLSMVYGFAKQSNGHVAIYSEEDQGTAVKLFLPRTDAQPLPGTPDAVSVTPRGKGETILVVEDDEEVCAMAVTVLEGLGYRVIGVPLAARALQILQGEQVDLMLSDIVLPGGMSGPELAERAKARYPDLAVVFMSGYPTTALKHRWVLEPGTVLLDKPFHRLQLAQAMHQALS